MLEQCCVDKGVRNPQTAFIDGVFLLHGRSSTWDGFVLYISDDAANWSKGTIIAKTDKPAGQYYSNSISLKDEMGNFLLVQYSESYNSSRVNVKHLKIRIKK